MCRSFAMSLLLSLMSIAASAQQTGGGVIYQPKPFDKQQVMDEAKAAAASARPWMRDNMNQGAANDATKGYGGSGTTPYITTEQQLNQATANRNLYCSMYPQELQCADERNARAQASQELTNRPNLSNDPNVQQANAISDSPGSVLGSIGGRYAGCTRVSNVTGVQTYDRQSCYNYLLRERDATCSKALDVRVESGCNVGETGPFTVPPATQQICRRTVVTPKYICNPGDLGPTQFYLQYWCTRADETTYPAIYDGETTTIIDRNAEPRIIEQWLGNCDSYERRVPGGLLPPDGINPPPPPVDTGATGGAATGSPAKCLRSNSICSAGAETRVFAGVSVTRACWGYTNTFDCTTLDPKSDCSQPRFGQCQAETPAPVCVDFDPIEPTFCTTWKQDYRCQVRNTNRAESSLDCNGQTYTDQGGLVWDTGHAKNQDFASVASYMEAAREAGRYLDVNTLEIFKGYDNRCKKKLYGLVNCCNKGGSKSFTSFTNFAVVFAARGKKDGSKFTYDGLFGDVNPRAFTGALLGGGGLPGAFSLESLVPNPWQAAMTAVTLAQMASCDKSDKDLALKRDAELCVDMGNYCSRRLLGCFERTQTYCCFNSRLAKAINVQGKQQLKISMGDAKNPNCAGLRVDQLQGLNLADMDLREFEDEVKLATEDVKASGSPTSCYYQGQCTPPPQ
jgi:conjugal transfer mating pair stabilization protein TraN